MLRSSYTLFARRYAAQPTALATFFHLPCFASCCQPSACTVSSACATLRLHRTKGCRTSKLRLKGGVGLLKHSTRLRNPEVGNVAVSTESYLFLSHPVSLSLNLHNCLWPMWTVMQSFAGRHVQAAELVQRCLVLYS